MRKSFGAEYNLPVAFGLLIRVEQNERKSGRGWIGTRSRYLPGDLTLEIPGAVSFDYFYFFLIDILFLVKRKDF